jgi:hypothetical protein
MKCASSSLTAFFIFSLTSFLATGFLHGAPRDHDQTRGTVSENAANCSSTSKQSKQEPKEKPAQSAWFTTQLLNQGW